MNANDLDTPQTARHGLIMPLLLVTLVLLIGSPATAHAEETKLSPAFKALLAGNISSHAADLSTTISGLRTGGLREANPAVAWSADRPWAMGATKAGMVGLSTWVKVTAYRRGHRKLAWIWLAAETGIISYVALRNHQLQR